MGESFSGGFTAGDIQLFEPFPRKGNMVVRFKGNGSKNDDRAGSKGFELIDYFPSPETLVGAGFEDPEIEVHATESMPGVDGKVGSAYIRARKS